MLRVIWESRQVSLTEDWYNALKYGALSSPSGHVSISGKIDRTDRSRALVFLWKESGGPRVSPPTRKGFGSVILRQAAESFGTVRTEYRPDGLFYEIRVDLSEIDTPRAAIGKQVSTC